MVNRPCNCVGAETVGLSDGSSVYGWQCSGCGHKWPRTPTERGKWRFEEREQEMARRYPTPQDS